MKGTIDLRSLFLGRYPLPGIFVSVATATFFLVLLFGNSAHAQEVLPADTEQVDLQSAENVYYFPEEDRAVFEGDVHVRYGPLQLSADTVSLHPGTGEFEAWGDLYLTDEDVIITGDYIQYDAASGNGRAINPFIFNDPVRIRGDEVIISGGDQMVVKSGFITTCNETTPHVSLRFRELELVRNKRVRLRHGGIYIRNIPVFYIPYLSMPANREAVYEGIRMETGEESFGGATVQTTVNYVVDQVQKGNVKLDYRSKRGPGGGVDHSIQLPGGSVSGGGYLSHDMKHPTRETRGSAWFYYNQAHSNHLRTFGEFVYVTDSSFREDYFYDLFRTEREPRGMFTVAYNRPEYYLQASVTGNPNPESYSFVERLPELRLGIPDHSLFGGRLYGNFFAQSTWFRLKNLDASDTQHFRQDAVSRLSYPFRVPGPFTVTPFLEGQATYYSRGRVIFEDRTRYLLSEGIGIETTRSQDWFHDLFRWQTIRHIFRPRLTFTHRSLEGARPEELIQYEKVDRLDKGLFVDLRLDNFFYGLHAARGQELLGKLTMTAVYDLNRDEDQFTDLDGIFEFWPNRQVNSRVEWEYNPALNVMDRLSAGLSYRSSRYQLSGSVSHTNGVGGEKDARTLGLGARWRINQPFEIDVLGTYDLSANQVDDAQYTFNWYLDCSKVNFTYRDQNSLDRRSFMVGFTLLAIGETPLEFKRSLAGD